MKSESVNKKMRWAAVAGQFYPEEKELERKYPAVHTFACTKGPIKTRSF